MFVQYVFVRAFLCTLRMQACLCAFYVYGNVQVLCAWEKWFILQLPALPLNPFRYSWSCFFFYLLDLGDISIKKLSHRPLLLNYWRLPQVICGTDTLTSVAFGNLTVLTDLELESFLYHNFLPLSLNCWHNLPSPSHSSVQKLNSWEKEQRETEEEGDKYKGKTEKEMMLC